MIINNSNLTQGLTTLNYSQGITGNIRESRDNNMSFNYLCMNNDFVILGSDSRETFIDGTYNDNRQKTFVNKEQQLCWSFTGLTKINGIDCIPIVNDIMNSKANIIEKLSLIEHIMCYLTCKFSQTQKKDSIFDLLIANSNYFHIQSYVLEVKNGISIIDKNRVYHQGPINTYISSGVHTEVQYDTNQTLMKTKESALKEMDRIIHKAMDKSQTTDKTVGGDTYIAIMDNFGKIETYINTQKIEF